MLIAAAGGANAQDLAPCQKGVDAAIAGKTAKFGSGGVQIAAGSRELLDSVAKSLKLCVGTAVEVSGHTVIIDPKVFGIKTAAHSRISAFPGELKRVEQMIRDTPQVVIASRVTGVENHVPR